MNPASDFPAQPVYLEFLVLKVSPDQREILVSQGAPVPQEDLDLMVPQEAKASPVYLVFLELVAHLDPPPLAHWGPQAPPDLQAQWDRQDSLDQTEQKVTLVLRVWTSQVCPEKEELQVSQVLQDQLEHQDPLEGLDEMVCLDCQVRKVTWVPWDPQDPLEDPEAQEDLVLLDLKVNLGTLAETVLPVVVALKERGVTPVWQDPLVPL